MPGRANSQAPLPKASANTVQSRSVTCPFCDVGALEVVGAVGSWKHQDSSVRSVMLAPLRHVEDFTAMADVEVMDMHRAILRTRQNWGVGESGAGVNVIWNLGAVAGQSIAHLHCHVVERTSGGPLAGYGARWWLKSGLRGSGLLALSARLNRGLKVGQFHGL
jgi:galactose-1-phosphate uridylyltransferase